MARCRFAVLLRAGVAGVFTTGGCWGPEAICSSGEYPVAAVRDTGRVCVKDGQVPPAGWVRFPPGKEPEYVDDRWDQYWQRRLLDENGQEVMG